MAKKAARRKKPRNQYTPIKGHKHQGKVLTPLLCELPLEFIDWPRDILPEYLWIDSLASSYPDLAWHKIFIDLLDKIETGVGNDFMLTGLLTDFNSVPIEARPDVLKTHESFIVFAFAEPIGRTLLLYPDSPGKWLLPDSWISSANINNETELEKLESAIRRMYRGKDRYTSRIRIMPLIQLLKHKKLVIPFPDIIELLQKYPGGCTDEEQAHIESLGRQLINMEFMLPDKKVASRDWPKSFWRHNMTLSPCQRVDYDRGELDEWERICEYFKELAYGNGTKIAEYVEQLALEVRVDLYDPCKYEVVLGLFTRASRLACLMLSEPAFWSVDIVSILSRCLIDTAITLGYLLTKMDDELFRAFVRFAKGKEKLLMLHLQDNYPGEDSYLGDDVDSLVQELGGGLEPEAISIELGHWCNVDARRMAQDAGFEKEYRLIYDPASSHVHGMWDSVRSVNLSRCGNLLHRFHFIPTLTLPPTQPTPFVEAIDVYRKLRNMCQKDCGFPAPERELDDLRKILEPLG
jgi:hypothetical protein